MRRKFILISLLLAGVISANANIEEGAKIYGTRCASCHKIKSDFIGPKLKDVTKRRDKIWLAQFIQSSQTMIKGGDDIARQLFIQFNQSVMPDHRDLSETQIESLLAYIDDESRKLDEAGTGSGSGFSGGGGYLENLALANKAEAEKIASVEFKIIYWGALLIIVAFVMWLGNVISVLSVKQ